MIEALERRGAIGPGAVLIEPTSGNTGIALAFVAAAKGYRLILCMPESMSVERRKMLALLGAELELTEAAKGMRGAIARAEAARRRDRGRGHPPAVREPGQPAVHRQTTAEEIWADTEGRIDAFVSGVGTGGTITGVGQVLRERAPDCRIVAVEPEDSPVLSGGGAGRTRSRGSGRASYPASSRPGLIDEVLTIGNETSFDTARARPARGRAGGISSGAAVAAAIEIAERPEMAGRRIVAILPSFAERYLSTALFDGL